MDKENMKKQFEIILKELEEAKNPELKLYATKLKEILDALRKEEKEEGEVDETPKSGRIIEVACNMETVSA